MEQEEKEKEDSEARASTAVKQGTKRQIVGANQEEKGDLKEEASKVGRMEEKVKMEERDPTKEEHQGATAKDPAKVEAKELSSMASATSVTSGDTREPTVGQTRRSTVLTMENAMDMDMDMEETAKIINRSRCLGSIFLGC